MPKFVVERDIPVSGAWTAAQRQAAARKSREMCEPSRNRGERMLILEHARRGGFPANRIAEVRAAMDPTTAEG